MNAPTGLLQTHGSRKRGFVDVTSFVTRKPVDFDASDLDVGSKLVATYKGTEHVVYVVPLPADWSRPPCWRERGWGRYVYEGERYKSLTAIARRIVGASDPRVSGNRFFGLRRRRRA